MAELKQQKTRRTNNDWTSNRIYYSIRNMGRSNAVVHIQPIRSKQMSMRDEIAGIIWHDRAGHNTVDSVADAIMELVQAHIDEQVAWVQDLATDLNNAEARIDELTKVLERLEHWFDTDDEILEEMGIAELEDHKRQHRYILATLKGTNK